MTLERFAYLCVASLPGWINLFSAWKELEKKCRFLPFFEPFKSLGFGAWMVLQFLAPILLFWFVGDLQNNPEINLELMFEGLVLGIGFVALLNATTEVGTIPIKIKPIYEYFVSIAYDLIADKQTRKTALFWTEFKTEIQNKNPVDLFAGLNYLENYFLQDISLEEQVKKDYQTKIEKSRENSDRKAQAKEIANLMEIRRKDLPEVLRQFQCSDTFIKKYFN